MAAQASTPGAGTRPVTQRVMGTSPQAGQSAPREIRVDQNGAAAGDTNTLLATIQNQAAAQVRAQTDFN